METKVNLCDECKKQIAENKCKICEKDICNKCKCLLSIGLFSKLPNTVADGGRGYGETNGIALGGCFICKNCKKNLRILIKKEHKDIIEKMMEYIKNEFVIGELENEGEPKQSK